MELLTILAIMAALAAMMYPVIMQAKDSARMTMCSSNLRQLGSAFRMYVDDHNGYPLLPHPQVILTKEPTYILYVQPLMPYIGQSLKQNQMKKIWVCPGDVGTAKWQSVWSKYGSSYRYQDYNGYVTVLGTLIIPHKLEQWRRPTVVPLFADHRGYYHRSVTSDMTDNEHVQGIGTHSVRSINMLMLDMHVTAISETELKAYLTRVVTERPKIDN